MRFTRTISFYLSFFSLLSLLGFPASFLQAQDDKYRFSRLDITRGLSNNEVTCVFKDEKGFLWLGTMSGLDRYDGYGFRVFHHDLRDTTSVNDDFILQIMEGPGHRLWITSREGLNLYDPLTEKFDRDAGRYLHSIHIDDGVISDIHKDRQGAFWFLTPDRGLYRYDPATGVTVHLQHQPADGTSLHSNQVTSAAVDSKGNWWIAYRDGWMEEIDNATGHALRHSTAVQRIFPHLSQDYRLYIDAQDDAWLYVSGKPAGVLYFHPDTDSCRLITRESPAGLNTNLVTGIVQDDKGIIWVATDHGGIDLLDKKDLSVRYLLSREDDPRGLAQNSIDCIYKDNTGVVWVGTYKKGVSYYHEDILKFPLYRHQPSNPNSLSYDDVNRFVEDARGNLWIGTNGGGLLYFNRQTGKYIQYTHRANEPASLSNDVIVSLCIDHTGRLWIGTYYGGLDCFDGQGFRHYRHSESDSNSLADDRIWEIHEDSRHRLWVGTLASGLDRFDREKNIFIHYRPGAPNSIVSGYISELQEDGQGNLWVGTAYGIDVLDGVTGLFRHYGNQPGNASSLSNNNVISIIEDSRGLIWVGTREGLDLLDRKRQTFTTFRTSDGLPDNAILTILEDNDHNLWLGTPSGLCNVIITPDPKGVDGYTFRYRNFDESHGLQGREFNENAALKTHSGELIFGGAAGYNRFDPQKLRSVARNPILVLTDLQLFNKTVGIGEPFNGHIPLPQSITESRNITLRYNENVFSLGFAVLDLLNAEKVKYAYQLEGFNNEWLVSNDKTRKAVFTNLDPGHYTFRVRTANEEGGWNEPALQVGITILPPFWKTPLAYACYVLLLAGILFLARRMVVQRAHMRFALEQERKEAHRLQELDRMKTRFFTNVSHEFRTPLSLILTPLDKIIRHTQDPGQQHQLNLIHRNARRLLNMVNQLLDFRKLEMQELRLNPNPGDIVRLIKELSFSFTDMAGKKNIEFFFQSTLQSLEMSFDQDKLERILFNLLSNAFKFTPEHGRVEVNLEMEGLWLRLSVQDTGIGIDKDKQEKIFERFFQSDIPGSMLNMGSGIGLAITREFVRLHGGNIRVSSEPGRGSCFTVLFPVPEKLTPVYMSSLIHDSGNDQLMVGPAAAGSPSGGGAAETGAIASMGNAAFAPGSVASNAVKGIGRSDAGETGGKERATAEPHPGKKPIVLLVEDNEDFRFYLKDNLKDLFIILEAVDGKEGWHKALGDHPDLVVSDISMPEMNGIDLCRKIKDDRRTSLIPVILLTALIGEEQQLRGLKTGANDYMTKPFNFEILVSKIQNLLQQQATARKTWQRQVQALPTITAVESPDEKFIRQALELVEKNIANPDFSVEEMSRVLYLSRVALYKKILSLTGRTPIEFIRSIRLKRAAQLLEKSKFTIAEIAYEVGFNNPKYFSRYFKDEFGMLPSAYQRSSRND